MTPELEETSAELDELGSAVLDKPALELDDVVELEKIDELEDVAELDRTEELEYVAELDRTDELDIAAELDETEELDDVDDDDLIVISTVKVM